MNQSALVLREFLQKKIAGISVIKNEFDWVQEHLPEYGYGSLFFVVSECAQNPVLK